MSGARPLRIALVTHGYKPAYRLGGPIESVSALAEGLAARGHHVRVLATDCNLDETLDVPDDTPQTVDGVEVWYFHRRPLLPALAPRPKSIGFLYAPAMRRRLDRLAPELDVIHTQIPFIYPTLAAARSARRHGVPLFYHQRGVLSPERLAFKGLKKALYMRCIEGPILRSAACLIALTSDERRDFAALSPGTPCRVIPNGIHAERCRTEPTPGSWPTIPADAPLVLFMGRLHPIKGADTLLEAFALVAARHPTAHLMLAGPDEWGIEQRFREQAAGLAGRVHFPGMLTGTAKAEALARADLFCLPSLGEGFSMAVLEAMASGAAVVLSPGCRFPEIETQGAGLIASNTVAATADALDRMLADPLRMAEMGRAARRLVAVSYQWSTVVAAMEDAYRAHVRSGP